MLTDEERTLSILRYIDQSVPLETKWWPVFRRYVDLYAGRVAGMGGDPTIIGPTGDGDWKHPEKCDHRGHADHDHRGLDDHDHRGHERDDCSDADRAGKGSITGKVVAMRYDHFGDFTGL